MAIGKPLNNKSFYGASESGSTPNIEMPPLDYVPADTTPSPWGNQQQQLQQPSSPFGNVPDQLPDEVRKEMSAFPQTEEPQYEQESSEPVQNYQLNNQSAQSAQKEPSESFKDIRAAKERAERERDAMLQQMLMMQQQMQQQHVPEPQAQPEEHYDFDNIDPESLAEVKHVKKVDNKLRNMEKQLHKYQSMVEANAIETRIRTQFPDFEKVVSEENIKILNEQYPQLALSLRDTPDMFNKAASAYTVIKNFGIYKDSSAHDADRARTVNNAAKPRPTAAVNPTGGESPLSKANAFSNGLTEELKAQLRREMAAARKNM